MSHWTGNTRTEVEMLQFGSCLAKQLVAPEIIFLRGDLGAGKTTLVRGLIRALGYDGIVKSPTYGLVEPYEQLSPPVYHFDLYRLVDPRELLSIGVADYFTKEHICIFEWPEQAETILPKPTIDIEIKINNEQRIVSVAGVEPFNLLGNN